MRAFGYAVGLGFILGAGQASATEDVMSVFFGNTVISTSPNGPETHTTYSPDHTFVMKALVFSFNGKWTLVNGTLCRNFESPPPGVTNPLCTPIAPHKIGDSWTVGDRTATLVKGVQ